MTFTFPLAEKRNVEELLKHLAQHKLSYPGRVVTARRRIPFRVGKTDSSRTQIASSISCADRNV
jgi:hypothetical protein